MGNRNLEVRLIAGSRVATKWRYEEKTQVRCSKRRDALLKNARVPRSIRLFIRIPIRVHVRFVANLPLPLNRLRIVRQILLVPPSCLLLYFTHLEYRASREKKKKRRRSSWRIFEEGGRTGKEKETKEKKINRILLTMIITKREAARTKTIAMTSKMATVAVTMRTVTRMIVMTMT